MKKSVFISFSYLHINSRGNYVNRTNFAYCFRTNFAYCFHTRFVYCFHTSFVYCFHTTAIVHAEWNLDRINELLAKNNEHISEHEQVRLAAMANKFDKHVYDIHNEAAKKPKIILEGLIIKYQSKVNKSTLKSIYNEIDSLENSEENMMVKEYVEHMNESITNQRKIFNNILAILKKDKSLGKSYFKSDEYKQHEKSLKDQWAKADEKIKNGLVEVSTTSDKAVEIKEKLISIDPDKYTHLNHTISISSILERFSASLVSEFADPSSEPCDYNED
jgi:hypothetical protein